MDTPCIFQPTILAFYTSTTSALHSQVTATVPFDDYAFDQIHKQGTILLFYMLDQLIQYIQALPAYVGT